MSKNEPPRGRFIVVDGCEGTGKSTILRKLRELLPESSTVFIREPGGTAIGEQIRSLLLDRESKLDDLTEFFLFWAARAQIVREIILPALLSGKNVVSDRFDSSTWAYQIVARGYADRKPLFHSLRRAVVGPTVPDLYVYLDLDPVIGFQRMGNREKDRIESEAMDFHLRVREGYQEFFALYPGTTIDASEPLEMVVDKVVEIIIKALGVQALAGV